jgi:hypothetical protein
LTIGKLTGIFWDIAGEKVAKRQINPPNHLKSDFITVEVVMAAVGYFISAKEKSVKQLMY